MSLQRNRHQRQCIECGEVLPPGKGIQFSRRNGPPVAKHPRCTSGDDIEDQGDWAELLRLQEQEESWHPEEDDWVDEEEG